MGITTDNQPVSFCRQLNDCGCGDAVYAQLAQQTDWLAFQVRRNIALSQSATNLIENGDFATGDLTGWTNNGDPLDQPWFYDAGEAEVTNANVRFLGQNIRLKAGKKYHLQFDYDIFAPGTLKVVGFKSYTDIDQEDDYDVLVEIAGDSSGTHNETIVTTNEYVRIAFWHESATTPSSPTIIDNIALYEYTGEVTIEITDCESDTALATIPASAFDFFDEYYNVKIKWEDLGLEPGNYCVCIRDANLFANGDFTNDDLLFWEQTNDGKSWDADPNSWASVTVSKDEESAVLFQEVCLAAGTYQVCLQNITGFAEVDYELVVNGEVVADGVAVGDDVCFDFTSTEDIKQIGVKVTGNSDADLTDVVFDNIRFTEDICSGCFDLAEDHDCSQLISWDNDCDAFGLYYGYYRNYLRIKSKTRHPRWKISDEEFFINPSGNRAILSAYGAAVEELVVSNQPGFVWGAIAIGLIHDNFYIDGISYTKNSGDIDPAWRISQDIVSEGVVEVFKNKQPNWKNYCFKKKSSTITGCGCDLSNYYTKSESNARYYTKSQSDARYWSLTGNAGTNPGVNFLGTTDAQNVQFKSNGTLAATLRTDQSWLYDASFAASSGSAAWDHVLIDTNVNLTGTATSLTSSLHLKPGSVVAPVNTFAALRFTMPSLANAQYGIFDGTENANVKHLFKNQVNISREAVGGISGLKYKLEVLGESAGDLLMRVSRWSVLRGMTVNAQGQINFQADTGNINRYIRVLHVLSHNQAQSSMWFNNSIVGNAGMATGQQHSDLLFNSTINLVSGHPSTSAVNAIKIDPTLTQLRSSDYIGVNFAYDNSQSYAIYQAGSSTKNKFEGAWMEMNNLPVAAPAEAGRLWNDSGTVKIT